jgi:hypothetical protein
MVVLEGISPSSYLSILNHQPFLCHNLGWEGRIFIISDIKSGGLPSGIDALFAPRRPRDHEPLFLGLCKSNATKSAAPSTPTLSFTHFCRPKISQAQNGFPRLTRPVFRRRLPVQHIAWTASTTYMDGLPTSCSPPPYCSTPIGHTTFSHNLLSII